VSVPPTREPLTLATLISERCRDLGLSQAEFVSRVGCRDIQRGIRRLHELFDADHRRTKALIEAISAALDLPDSVVYRAAQVSQRLFDDRRRRRFEVEEATLAAFMRCPTANKQKKSSDSIVSYLRLISS
jgi:transcription initiation factor TFIIIB Brf1 subunit/transcription initiation factor TFIIB